MATTTPILIVDDNAARRAEVKRLLDAGSWNVVAESGYGVQAVTFVQERKPAVVLHAVEEPLNRAAQTIESLRAAAPDVEVVAYSTHETVDVVRQAMRAGARDFLTQPLTSAALEKALAEALAHKRGETAKEPSAPGAGTIISVIGAKGGIGKSTIAVNIATAIAGRKQDTVLLVDMDTRFGDVAIMMDVEPKFVTADIAASVGTLTGETFRNALVQHESGVWVLPSAKSPSEWRSMNPAQVRDLLRFAARQFDYVIVDTPGVFGENVAAAVEQSAQVILVTTVDITSVKDTTFVLEVLERTGIPRDRVVLTVNHANGTNSVSAADVSRVLHADVKWELPHDPAISVGLQSGKPVVLARPRSNAARSFNEMAAQLTGAVTEKDAAKGSGLFRRMLPGRE